MFDQTQSKARSPFWKFLPVALALFVALVGSIIYFSSRGPVEPEQLSGVLHEGDPDFSWYSEYLRLREPSIQMGLNFAGNRVVMLSAILENLGERTIDVIELKVQFFNYEELIWETVRTPIRPGPYTPPIPPVSERAINFYIEAMPEGWLAGHAEMSIHGFRFRSLE